MADNYVEYIANGLKELSPFLMSQSFFNYWNGQQFCPENHGCLLWNWDDFYLSLAWQGLTKTEEWINKSDEFKNLYDEYARKLNEIESSTYKCN